MTHASLFSGIGGAELAAYWMGWENVFHCEINPFGRKVLEYWFPNSVSYDDITKTDFTTWRGKVDILTGGFPCQPFFLAGKRKGAEDDRYLWPEMLCAIREIQPAWVVGENVAGLTTMVQPGETAHMGRAATLFDSQDLYLTTQRYTLADIISSLEESGYAVQPFLIPACAVGAPHRRDRLWIVANAVNAGVRASRNGGERDGQTEVSERRHEPLDKPCRPCEERPATHTVRNRRGKGSCYIQSKFADGEGAESNGSEWDATNTSGKGLERPERRTMRSEKRAAIAEHSAGMGKEQSFDKPNGAGWLNTQRNDDGKPDTSQQAQCRELQPIGADCPQDWWRQFPLVSPVCRGNDGLPFDMARLTISEPSWRKEAIKAMGNAWVPQVAYEIFRAIQEEENEVCRV